MRAWTFVPRGIKNIVHRERYYLLYDEDTVKDVNHKIDSKFYKYCCYARSIVPGADADAVIRPVPILLNLSEGKPIGMEDFYPSIKYIKDVMNVNLDTSDLVELDVSFDEMFAVYDVVDDCFIDAVDSNILANKSIEMHPLIGAVPCLEVHKIIGLYNVSQWDNVLLFESHRLSFMGNPFSVNSLYVSLDGIAQTRHLVHYVPKEGDGVNVNLVKNGMLMTFTPMSRYEVYQQRLASGARRALDDTSIYNALHVVSRRQSELINARVRKLSIHPDDWIYVTLADIKKKEEGGK